MFPDCSCFCMCIHKCVSSKQILLARYLGYLYRNLTKLSPLSDFGARMSASNFEVKGQGHSGVKYAPKCTFSPCSSHMLAEA